MAPLAFTAGGSAFPVMGRCTWCRTAFVAGGTCFPEKGGVRAVHRPTIAADDTDTWQKMT